MRKFLIVHQQVKLRERWFNFTGHKVICPLLPLFFFLFIMVENFRVHYILSADGNCFILHVSFAALSPPGLAGFSFCPSLESLNQGWLLADESNLGQALGGIPSGRDLREEKVWMGSHCRRNYLASISPWTPKICIYKQSSHARYDKTTSIISSNVCYSLSPRNPVWRHAPVSTLLIPQKGALHYQVSISPHGHGWLN